METQSKCWSIGHSNRSLNEFIELLESADIQTVIDVRTKPRSRFYWFNGASLARSLEAIGMNYEHQVSLGGLERGDDYDEVLDSLVARVGTGERLALLCSEGKPEQCHRGTELTPELVKRGVRVEHLLYGGRL